MSIISQTPPPRKELFTAIARPSRTKSEARSSHVLWLDKNENMDPDYIASLQNLINNIPAAALFGYPDCYALYHQLALNLGVAIDELILAPGSDGIIRAVYEAYVSPGDTVLYTEPTFAMYALYTKMYGAHAALMHYEPSANGPCLSVTTVIDRIQATKPRLVCLPNPNSPSGTVFTPSELHAIIDAAGEVGAVILIDEAYYPFYPETALPLISVCPHLIVARTFSKAWGMAGIRLGFGVGCVNLIRELHKIRPMYEVGALSVTLAERVLAHEDEMLVSVARLNDGKQFFLTAMQQLGFKTYHAEGNFCHVAFGALAPHIHQTLADKVLYRQDFSHPSLAGYSRFTATTRACFAPVIDMITSVAAAREVKYG